MPRTLQPHGRPTPARLGHIGCIDAPPPQAHSLRWRPPHARSPRCSPAGALALRGTQARSPRGPLRKRALAPLGLSEGASPPRRRPSALAPREDGRPLCMRSSTSPLKRAHLRAAPQVRFTPLASSVGAHLPRGHLQRAFACGWPPSYARVLRPPPKKTRTRPADVLLKRARPAGGRPLKRALAPLALPKVRTRPTDTLRRRMPATPTPPPCAHSPRGGSPSSARRAFAPLAPSADVCRPPRYRVCGLSRDSRIHALFASAANARGTHLP